MLLIINELFLALLAIYDYVDTGKFASFQIVTIIFYLYLLLAGKKDMMQLDQYFRKKVAKWKDASENTITSNPTFSKKLPQTEKEHAREERKGWYMHFAIFTIAQIIFLSISDFTGFHALELNHISTFFQVYSDEKMNRANGIWGIILIVDFIWSFSYSIWP